MRTRWTRRRRPYEQCAPGGHSAPDTLAVFYQDAVHNAAAKTLFVYNKVIYEKDEALQQIEEVNGRINMVLLLVLLVMFFTASTTKNIYVIVAGMAVIVAGELVRLLRLPKDIKAHLTDTGRRER